MRLATSPCPPGPSAQRPARLKAPHDEPLALRIGGFVRSTLRAVCGGEAWSNALSSLVGGTRARCSASRECRTTTRSHDDVERTSGSPRTWVKGRYGPGAVACRPLRYLRRSTRAVV